jgi:hypothetical protein
MTSPVFERNVMPHARIDLARSHQPRLPEYSAAILKGMSEGLGFPDFDFFQIFRLHDENELFYSATFPTDRRTDVIFVEILAQVGYTDEQKQAAMNGIVDGFVQLGVPRETLLCDFLEVHGAAWLDGGMAGSAWESAASA